MHTCVQHPHTHVRILFFHSSSPWSFSSPLPLEVVLFILPASFPSAFQLHVLHYPSLFPTSPKISSPHHHPLSDFKTYKHMYKYTPMERSGVRTGQGVCQTQGLHIRECGVCCLAYLLFLLLLLFFGRCHLIILPEWLHNLPVRIRGVSHYTGLTDF